LLGEFVGFKDSKSQVFCNSLQKRTFDTFE
jgi:hypothetical protein